MQFLQPGKQDDENESTDREEAAEANSKIVAFTVGVVVQIHCCDGAEKAANRGKRE